MKTLSESRQSLLALRKALTNLQSSDRLLIALSPISLTLASEFNMERFKLIAQDVSNFDPGAHTGQTTVEQLKDLAIETTLIGHSERRKECGEDDLLVVEKVIHSLERGLEVVLCFGEDLSDRQEHRTKQVLTRQLSPLVSALKERGLGIDRLVFAYEPVWAIGSGLTADLVDIEEISSWVRDFINIPGLRFIYGGSVNLENIRPILSSRLVDGVLIGSASAKPDSFFKLIEASSEIIKGNSSFDYLR